MADKTWISTSSTSFSTAGNWAGGAPANSDRLIFNGSSSVNCETNLDSSLTGVTVVVEPSYTGKIGTIAAGVVTPLTLDGGTLILRGNLPGQFVAGSQRILIAFGSTAATVKIEYSNPTGEGAGYPPVNITGTVITASVIGGNVGFAVYPGQVATLASLNVTAGGGQAPSVTLGEGVTLTSGVQSAGTMVSKSANTTAALRIGDGQYTYTGTGAHSALNMTGGTAYYNGSGALTAGVIDGGTLNLTQNAAGCTVTDCTVRAKGKLLADNGKPGGIVFTNPVQFPDGIAAGQLTLPPGMKTTIATI